MSSEDEKSVVEEATTQQPQLTREELGQLKRREIQRIAKTQGIKANQKTSAIIEQLLNQWAESSNKTTQESPIKEEEPILDENDPSIKENVDTNVPNNDEVVIVTEPELILAVDDRVIQTTQPVDSNQTEQPVCDPPTIISDEPSEETIKPTTTIDEPDQIVSEQEEEEQQKETEESDKVEDPLECELHSSEPQSELVDPSEQTDITEVTESSDLCRKINNLNTNDMINDNNNDNDEEEREEQEETSTVMIVSEEPMMINEMEILPCIHEGNAEDEAGDNDDDDSNHLDTDHILSNQSVSQSDPIHHPTRSFSSPPTITDHGNEEKVEGEHSDPSNSELSEVLKSTLDDSALMADPEVEKIQRTMLEMKQSVEERRAKVQSMWNSLKNSGPDVDDSSYLKEHQDLVRLQAKFVSVCSDYVSIVTPAKAKLLDRSRLNASSKNDVSDKEFVSKKKAELMQSRGFTWDDKTGEWVDPKHNISKSSMISNNTNNQDDCSSRMNSTNLLPDFDAIHQAEFDRNGEDLADYQRRKEERRRSLSAYTPFAGRSSSSVRKNRGMRSRPQSGTPAVKKTSIVRPQSSLNPKRKLQWSEQRRNKRSLSVMDETSDILNDQPTLNHMDSTKRIKR